MISRFYTIPEKLKQAARQVRGKPVSGSSPSAKTLTYLNGKNPAKAHQHIETKDLKTDTELRKIFVQWFTGILIGQLLVMNGTFILIGTKLLHLSDLVINPFVGGTLAGVLGTVLMVAYYLFPKYIQKSKYRATLLESLITFQHYFLDASTYCKCPHPILHRLLFDSPLH